MTNPTLITTPFAENGDKNDIPEVTGVEPQNATLEKGFPEITQTPISAGGIPPERKDFNGILNLYGQHIVHLNKGLPYEFDAAFATAIGGYPLHARIMLNNGDIVQNTVANNTNNPNSNMSDWSFENKNICVGVGDGVSNDYTAVQNILSTGYAIFLKGKTYNLNNQELSISNSVTIELQEGVSFINGYLKIIPTDSKKSINIKGDFNLGDNFSLRLGGVVTPSVVGDGTDPYKPDPAAVKILCNDISASSQSKLTTTTINISSYVNSKIGNITAICDSPLYDNSGVLKPKPVGVYLGNGYDSIIGNLYESGVYTLGIEVDSSSSRSAFSMCRCEIGNVYTFKPSTTPDSSGHHGFYFHGAYDTSIGIVRGSGWGLTISSSADFKFRDNMNCTVESVEVDRFRITSDANYIWFDNYAKDNTFKNVNVFYFATVVSAGFLKNNYFLNTKITQCALSSNNGNERGIVMQGETIIGGSGSDLTINSSSLVFDNARVSWALSTPPDIIGTPFTANKSRFLSDLNYRPSAASVMRLSNVVFDTNLNHEPTSDTANPKSHTSNFNSVNVFGNLLIKTFSGNTHSADWCFVNSWQNLPNTGRQPTTKRYRFVSYNDANYPALNS